MGLLNGRCCGASNIANIGGSTIALRIPINQRGNTSGRCGGLSRQAMPNAFYQPSGQSGSIICPCRHRFQVWNEVVSLHVAA
jgi:hypothetical protein